MIFKFRSDKTEHAFQKIADFCKDPDWYVIDIRKSKRIRSLPQNKFYWGVVLKIISDHTGFTSEEAHQVMAAKWLGYESHGRQFVKSTTRLTTLEFEEYLQQIRGWAAEEMLVKIPLPNEITEEMYLIIQNLKS